MLDLKKKWPKDLIWVENMRFSSGYMCDLLFVDEISLIYTKHAFLEWPFYERIVYEFVREQSTVIWSSKKECFWF